MKSHCFRLQAAVRPLPNWLYLSRAVAIVLFVLAHPSAAQQERIVHVDLMYRAPGNGPKPDFSPYGTQVKLSALSADAQLPEGATRPAKVGTLQVGPDKASWITILATADSTHPLDLSRLYIDRNRNGSFNDDGPALNATLTLNDKTKAWWSTFNGAEIPIRYDNGIAEPYRVSLWTVREGGETPNIIRYQVRSWRSGAVTVDGIEALISVMDSDNNAVFDGKDKWSILNASETDAATRVLSIREARSTDRFMFLQKKSGTQLVLEFRSLTRDGRSLTLAVVNRAVTKEEDRAPDDSLLAERSRPRTSHPFPWIDGVLEKGIAQAKGSGRRTIIDFWTSWCGPCHSLDEWVWTDAEVADILNTGYVGAKLDGDLEKDLVARFRVTGYPTIILLDSTGKEIRRFGYLSSKEMLKILR